MCLNPSVLRDGTVVACNKCKLCLDNRVNDWSGRCIAESITSYDCHSITLTYGRERNQDGTQSLTAPSLHPRSVILTYSDVQKYFKYLRKEGYPLRYFVVGEYGGEKGRSHWHVVIFWQSESVPPHKLNVMFDEKHWPHGHSYWQSVPEDGARGSIRYVTKYIVKDLSDAERQGHMSLSKKPPIGHQYFKELAHKYVQQGISPDLYYTFPNSRLRDGRLRKYKLSDVSADNFLQEFICHWHSVYGHDNWPQSDAVDKYIGSYIETFILAPWREEAEHLYKQSLRSAPRRPQRLPAGATMLERLELTGLRPGLNGAIYIWTCLIYDVRHYLRWVEGEVKWQSDLPESPRHQDVLLPPDIEEMLLSDSPRYYTKEFPAPRFPKSMRSSRAKKRGVRP